ncbi:MAG: hypothetical protein KJ607_03305, partial [Bacteroidetes bacterium]|nr:hypothetical protein [Bacteroidota bacterium]
MKFCKLDEAEPVLTKDYNEFVKQVEETATGWIDELEALDLEEVDWEEYTPRHSGYIPEYEAIQHEVEDRVEEVFDSWADQILDLLIKQEFEQVLVEITAMYLACRDAELDDPYDNLGGDPNEHLLSCFNDRMKENAGKVQNAHLNMGRAIGPLCNFLRYFKENLVAGRK